MTQHGENIPTKHQTTAVYPGHRVLLMFPVYNEAAKLRRLVKRLRPGIVDKIVAINDGSTDDGPAILREHGVEVWDQPRQGIGASIKRTIAYAQENGYDIMVLMAGNNKDNPLEVPRLLAPLVKQGADYVQGSRFLPGGDYPNLPLFRYVAIRMLSMIFSIVTAKGCSDLTNGFRAYKVSLFDDPKINIWQDWLDTYEYEYYVHWKVYTLGYRVREAPVTKAYPDDKKEQYTKVQPLIGWWRALRPLVYLALHIKD